MLTISRPLSAAQVRTYHANEFTNARENYYTADTAIHGHWHGQLAREWGLAGEVDAAVFERLADGQHPHSGEPLVQHQVSRTYLNAHGDRVKTMAHRAGWDATFSAPKSVSLTALVGGDDHVRAAHRASAAVALDEIERYVQARIGQHAPEATANWVAATFEHDSARPVHGYAAPQLHTHAVFFNLTRRDTGEIRPIQPRELYKTQAYGTAVYRSELATRLTALGYAIEPGASGQPEIRGYTAAYLEASSPRRQQIQEHLAKVQLSGAAAAQIAAHQTREAKRDVSHEEMQRQHRELAAAFGDQPAQVVQAAAARAQAVEPPEPAITAHAAMTYAKERNLERDAVVEERALLRDALRRSMGEIPRTAITDAFESRVQTGEFIPATQRAGTPGRAFTTQEMIDLEADTIQRMRAGRETQPPLVPEIARRNNPHAFPQLSAHQRTAVEHILGSRDQVQALEGVAGAGKTTALAAVRDGAEREGYRVEGFAPTSRAAHQLAEAGIPATTLQRHLIQGETPPDGHPRLYVLDESSLASTRQMHQFLERLHPPDRVLLVGDVRQHQAVEAGRPYQQLQEAGIDTTRLDEIVRQKDPALRTVVEHLARGQVREAIAQLDGQGRVHEIPSREERFTTMAREYAKTPRGTLVVSPDHDSRRAINQIIHAVLQTAGHVEPQEHRMRILVARQEITGADRQWAAQYAPGDLVRYTKGSTVVGLQAGAYARVAEVDASANRLTVMRPDGTPVTYDPHRLQGVTLYREAERAFAVGDRLQFTAPYKARHIANRELGTLDRVEATGMLQVRLDSGRQVAFKLDAHPHLDYGYAVTSHSSQGQTADRVLVHVDTERLGEQLVNRRLAYVAVSRGRYDAQIYTNDAAQLGQALSRDVSHRSAIESRQAGGSPGQEVQPSEKTPRHVAELTLAR